MAQTVESLTARIKELTKLLVNGSAIRSKNDKQRLINEREGLRRERRKLLDARRPD